MPKARVVVELDGPAIRFVERVARSAKLCLVGNNLDVLHQLLTQQVLQESLDHRNHTRAEHDHRDVMGPSPDHEVLEIWVERDVLAQDVKDLGKWHLPRIEHFLECIAEGISLVDDSVKQLASFGVAHAIVVRDKVIGVLEGDGPIEVGEEDYAGLRVESLWEGHDGKMGGPNEAKPDQVREFVLLERDDDNGRTEQVYRRTALPKEIRTTTQHMNSCQH